MHVALKLIFHPSLCTILIRTKSAIAMKQFVFILGCMVALGASAPIVPRAIDAIADPECSEGE